MLDQLKQMTLILQGKPHDHLYFVRLASSDTDGRGDGWAIAERVLDNNYEHRYVVTFILANPLVTASEDERLVVSRSEPMRDLRDAITNAMKGLGIERQLDLHMNHPLFPLLLRHWSGIGSGVKPRRR